MSDDRLAQARAEAERLADRSSWTYTSQKAARMHGFMQGVEWADAHPESTPEALVAAYEDGQRDAVSKGLARLRITRARMLDLAYDGAIFRDGGMDEARLRAHFKAAGIEVVDDE